MSDRKTKVRHHAARCNGTVVRVVTGVGGRRGRRRRHLASVEIGRAILDPRRAGWNEALALGARMLPKAPVPGGRRRRRQLARQRRKERDRLVALVNKDDPTFTATRPSYRRDALEIASWHAGRGCPPRCAGFAERALLGRPTAEDISELLRRGFPLHAGLRGAELAAHRRKHPTPR